MLARAVTVGRSDRTCPFSVSVPCRSPNHCFVAVLCVLCASVVRSCLHGVRVRVCCGAPTTYSVCAALGHERGAGLVSRAS